MSTIVYQGFFEPQPTETTTLRLKLAAPKPIDFENTITTEVFRDDKKNTTNQMTKKSDLGGWNFLQSLSNSTPKKAVDSEKFYPSLRLSQKSLELCTENLGSETGSDDTGDIDILSFTSTEARSVKSTTTTTTTMTRRAQGHVSSAKKANTRSFPPPLTTISGSNSIQVRPHREGGRLIMEAVEAPCNRTCFEAERSNGRLQLKFLKNCEFFYDQTMSSEDNQDDNIGESESKDNDTSKTEDVFEEDEANNNIVDEVKNVGYMKKDMDGNRKDVEVEMGRDKFQRHNRRCKESGHGNNNNKGICFREAFWVAT
ncbi:Fantastic four [Heracleum sosnowskyi]|uniref:Fantastic four n=1 Tax=Heracleum sosnowskyi TaxID=360622 RepID=A0AAD8J3C8_9APIA|nr:Fantastic four [Heracleum sosnowskyi]